jgi:hypothetical protein
MKNWKTNIAGIGAYLGTLLLVLQCHAAGGSWLHCIGQAVIGGAAGTGLLLAKDHDTVGAGMTATKVAE